jgi:hypothetical protein
MDLDSDLKPQYLAAALCVLANVALLIYSLARCHWGIAIAALVWLGCSCVLLANARAQQKTRDMVRIFDSQFREVDD